MANPFGTNNINLEEDDLEAEPDGESPSSPVFSYAYDHSACDPYFPFSDSDTDSGLLLFSDPRSDLARSFIDFSESSELSMAEEFHPDPGSRPSGVGDFNLFGFEDEDEEELELGLGVWSGSGSGSRRQVGDSGPGLSVIGIDSDSDYGDAVYDLNSSRNGNRDIDSGRVEDETGLPTPWDSFYAEEGHAVDDELEWEEVQNAIHGITSADGNPDWEVLLAVNNIVSYIEHAEGTDFPVDTDPDYYLYLAASGVYAMNYGDYGDAFEQMLDNESVIRGNPPASKRVVEDLPVVKLTVEESGKGIVCAVCNDEITVEESVRRLPCSHYYHGECIIPWLGIRNTCPVCRYELPTDDRGYERYRRRQSGAGGSVSESLVRYDSDFEMFA